MRELYIAKKYQGMKSTAMSEADVMAKEYDDVIDFSLGDPDFNTDESIIAGAAADARRGYTHYADFRGDPELRKAIVDFYKEEYGLDIFQSEVFVTAGACVAMYLALESILDPGDEVIIQAPYFTPYPYQVRLAGGVPVELSTYENEDYQINEDRLESLITNRTKALVINYPANPTGTCYTKETLEGIAKIAKKYNLAVISDEIYTAFSYQTPFIPLLSISDMKERSIIINSFSKNFNMTGWRVGNIIAPEYLVDLIKDIDGKLTFTASSVSQRAAIHALKHRKRIQKIVAEEYMRRVHYAYERINRIPNMSVPLPQGTFYLFINIKDTGLDSVSVSKIILEEAHVLVIPGNGFGVCGEGYIRIACTMSVERMQEAFDRIEKVSIFQKH